MFVPLWLINLYNFIDGIDGMASSGAVFICAAATTILALAGASSRLSVVFALLGASNLGFLLLHVPPAKIFMGDAGSIFLGYCFAALLLTTVFTRQISVWTWIAMLGYFIADTTTTTLWEIVAMEKTLGLDRADTLTAFGDRIARLGERLRALLGSLKSQGNSIGVYGAPTKAVTLLSHFGIGAESIDFVVEDNPLKHGRYLPVSHIPVVSTDELYRRRPDYALILAWNFAAPIMKMHPRYADEGGHFIVPMPESRIV